MFLAKNFQLVELPVRNAGANSNVYFQQQPQLQSYIEGNGVVYVKGLEVYSNTALTTSPQSTGLPVAAHDDILNATITLVERGRELKRQIPLARLNTVFPNDGTSPIFPPQTMLFKSFYEIDWTKCYITTVAAPAVNEFCYLFGVYYDFEDWVGI